MKHSHNLYAWKSILIMVFVVILNSAAIAQVPDTTKLKEDSMAAILADTTAMATDTTAMVSDTAKAVAVTAAVADSSKKEGGKPKHFSIYAGGNSNTMSGSTEKYNSNAGVGYHIGVAWEKGGFVYYQFGLRYNSAVYGFNSKVTSKDTGDLKVQAIDVPLTLGINFLSFAKIISLRVFISAMPSFTVGVNDNNFGVKKDDVESFIFYGQAGIGANIAFLYLDLGYNYGTQSLMKKSVGDTNPGQAYLSLGVRF